MYDGLFDLEDTNNLQIRIVRDQNPNPKKPHRGYAFIVYEREKDMKGISPAWNPLFDPNPLPPEKQWSR